MALEKEKFLMSAAECLRYFRSKITPDMVTQDILMQGGIELEYSNVVVPEDFAKPLTILSVELDKCRGMWDVLLGPVFESVARKEVRCQGWLDAYYCALCLTCATLEDSHAEMIGFSDSAVSYLLSHVMETDNDDYANVVLDLFKGIRRLMPDGTEYLEYELARIIDMCIICITFRLLAKNIKMDFVDWRECIESESTEGEKNSKLAGWHDSTSVKAVLQRHLLKYLKEMVAPPHGTAIDIVAMCSNLALFLDVVAENDSTQAESQPKTDGNEGQKK